MAAPAKKDQDEAIPPLQSVAPSIWVQLQEDLTAAFEDPVNRAQYLKDSLANLDLHSKEVQKTLLYMFHLEKKRLIREGRKFPGVPQTGLSPEETDAMLANMEAPYQPDRDYSLDISSLQPRQPNFAEPREGETPREWSFKQVMRLVEGAINEVRQYGAHADGVKQVYSDALKREVERDEAFATTDGPTYNQ